MFGQGKKGDDEWGGEVGTDGQTWEVQAHTIAAGIQTHNEIQNYKHTLKYKYKSFGKRKVA